MKKIKKHKKKILIGCLILVILVGACFGGYKYYKHYEATKTENKNWLNRHIALEVNDEGVYEVNTINTDEDLTIFNLVYQDVIESKIEELKNSENYSLDNPLIIYNPYGTGSLSYYVYLGKDYDDLSYTIKTDGYSDYSHDLSGSDEYQLVGFVPGEVNNLTLSSDSDEKKMNITTPDIKEDVDITLEQTDGESNEDLTDGLYAVLGHDKNYEANIYLYDNAGVLRNELVLDDYRADRIIFDDDYMYYPYKSRGIMKVNSLGKIVKMYDLGKYRMHHDMILDGNKLVILVDEVGADTKEDVIITLNLNTGEVKEVVDMKDLLGELYEKAVLPEDYETLDWLHLNCLTLKGDDLILSAREVSTIIYLSDYATNPKIKYLIADESMLEGTSYDDLLYTKVGDFVSQAGQHAVTYIPGESDDEYYLIMFNNNYASIVTRPDFKWDNYPGTGSYEDGETSYYYMYKVNEKDKTYELEDSLEIPYSSIVSSVQLLDDNLIVGSGMDNSFGEYDKDGDLIKEFGYGAKKYAYRVFKYSFDNWFK